MTDPSPDNLAPQIPHRGRMHWLDHARMEDGAVLATRTLTADHPFLRDGVLPRAALIEMLSQAAACEAAHAASANGAHVHQGMLVAIRDFVFTEGAPLPRAGDTLILLARREKSLGPLTQCVVQAQIAGKTLAQGRMTFHLTVESPPINPDP